MVHAPEQEWLSPLEGGLCLRGGILTLLAGGMLILTLIAGCGGYKTVRTVALAETDLPPDLAGWSSMQLQEPRAVAKVSGDSLYLMIYPASCPEERCHLEITRVSVSGPKVWLLAPNC